MENYEVITIDLDDKQRTIDICNNNFFSAQINFRKGKKDHGCIFLNKDEIKKFIAGLMAIESELMDPKTIRDIDKK